MSASLGVRNRSYSGVFFGQTRANVFTTANHNKGKNHKV